MRGRRFTGNRRNSPGYTLIELIVAVLVASIVLMGAFSILTNMVTAEVNGLRNGTVTAYSLASINSMNADISGAGALSYPAPSQGDNSLIVCRNWSTKTGQVLYGPPPPIPPGEAYPGSDVYEYCWDQTDAPPFKNSLLRYIKHYSPGSEICPTVPLSCNQAAYSAGDTNSDTIVATGVYLDAANDKIFTADGNTLNGLRIRFAVGNPAANAVSAGGNNATVTAAPVSVPFDTEIILEN